MYRPSSLETSLKAAKALVVWGLCLATSLAMAADKAKLKDKNEDPKPVIEINFDDDSTSLVIATEWAEDGKGRRETFSYGKDIYLSSTREGKKWVDDPTFRSKNYEAYLYPDMTGFILMEREYDGKRFENVSLRYVNYFPKRRSGSLRPANGSPWWSLDGKQFAVVETLKNEYNIVTYDADAGKVLSSRSHLNDAQMELFAKQFVKARICDDEVPCETPAAKQKKKWWNLLRK